MKKCIITLMVALMAIGAEAQVTWNVRLGGGIVSRFQDEEEVAFAGRLFVQSNIPFSSDNRWVFSPTFSAAIGSLKSHDFILPLYVGYKAPINRNVLFIPKVGPVFGFRPGEKRDYHSSSYIRADTTKVGFIFGPSVEFCFEIKHFVVALNGYYSVVKQKRSEISVYEEIVSTYKSKYPLYGASLTLGYKF